MTEVSIEDKTPRDFTLEKISFKEKIKRPIRRYFYPMLVKYRNKVLNKKFSFNKKLNFNNILLGDKGSDYASQRKRVDDIKSIEASTILIIGVGTGSDLESWLQYKPKKIIAVDYFNYEKAWTDRKKFFAYKYTTEIEFIQSDILNMNMIESDSVDIIGSDAVFEHINKFDAALKELYRVLKYDGLIYATYGPLWYCWGGDHISGSENLENGFNHIKLSTDEYEKYLDTFGNFSHSEHDGRTWVKNNLFSYLKPYEYIQKLEAIGLRKKYTACILAERALVYKETYSNDFKILENKFGLENLIITGMTVVYGKQQLV